jgi:hypothetical protein
MLKSFVLCTWASAPTFTAEVDEAVRVAYAKKDKCGAWNALQLDPALKHFLDNGYDYGGYYAPGEPECAAETGEPVRDTAPGEPDCAITTGEPVRVTAPGEPEPARTPPSGKRTHRGKRGGRKSKLAPPPPHPTITPSLTDSTTSSSAAGSAAISAAVSSQQQSAPAATPVNASFTTRDFKHTTAQVTGNGEAGAGVNSERVGAASIAGVAPAPAVSDPPPNTTPTLTDSTTSSSAAGSAAIFTVVSSQQQSAPAATPVNASFTTRDFKHTTAQVTGNGEAGAGVNSERVGAASIAGVAPAPVAPVKVSAPRGLAVSKKTNKQGATSRPFKPQDLDHSRLHIGAATSEAAAM